MSLMFWLSYEVVFAADQTLQLQVPTPTIGTELTLCTGSGDNLSCGGIAKYITAVYEWLIRLAIILGVLTLTLAGYFWMTARGDKKQTEKAVTMIKNTLWGIVLALGSYTLLWAVNPDLVRFNVLNLGKIKEMEIEIDHRDDPTPAKPGTGCVTAAPDEILNLINSGSVHASSEIQNQIKNGKNGKTVDPRTLGAVKVIQETCGGGFGISSGIRSTTGNHAGLAVDLTGNICGKQNGPGVRDDPENYCNHSQFKGIVEKLVGLGYRVGAWRGRCGTFMECPSCTGATGVHMHVDVNHGACKTTSPPATPPTPNPAPGPTF